MCAVIGVAGAATIDFEGFAPGRIMDNEYAGVTIGAVNFSHGPDAAIIFDTEETYPLGGDFDLVGPFDSQNEALEDGYRPGNVLIIQERNDCDFASGFCATPDDEGDRPAGEFHFAFDSDIVLHSLDFFDIEAQESQRDSNSEIHLFDAGGAEIYAGMFYVPETGGDNLWNRLDFGAVAGIRSIVIEFGGSGAIDNLQYDVVPVPAAVWLFGSALVVLGGIRRSAGRRLRGKVRSDA